MKFTQPNYLHIEKLLDSEEVALIQRLAQEAEYADGKVSASAEAAKVKHNLQAKDGSLSMQRMQNVIMKAISRRQEIQKAILPKMILPPLITQYHDGMTYGMHVDSPLMGSQYTIRTDVGMTLFLSEPESYEGGELLVLTEVGEKRFKLPPGDAVLYPTTKLHEVIPVTSGNRLVAVTWMQSAIRDPAQREMLSILNQATASVAENGLKEEHLALQQVYANLVRMWAEL